MLSFKHFPLLVEKRLVRTSTKLRCQRLLVLYPSVYVQSSVVEPEPELQEPQLFALPELKPECVPDPDLDPYRYPT
jgi:hypothetical protein